MFVPILPMELFGRSMSEYEAGTLIGSSENGDQARRPLATRHFDAVKGVRLAQRILLAERLRKPKLDPRRTRDIRRVLEACPAFDPESPPPVSTFESLFFDHPLFLGRGASLLRWLSVSPTRRAYASLLARVYPKIASAFVLGRGADGYSDRPASEDARYLRSAVTAPSTLAGRSEADLEAGWLALTGGGDEPPPTPEDAFVQLELARDVRALIDRLPRRKSLAARAYFGIVGPTAEQGALTMAEIADLLDVSAGRVHQILRDTIRRLAWTAAHQARREGMTPAARWGRRPSEAAGLLRVLAWSQEAARSYADLVGASEEAVARLIRERSVEKAKRRPQCS